MDDNYRTPLISAAIGMAARNLGLPPGAVFHSDRGSNYTSAEFAGILGGLGIRQSVGRTGSCFDNALAESFNAAVNVERVHRTVYPTRRKAREDIERYIEAYAKPFISKIDDLGSRRSGSWSKITIGSFA